MEAETIPSGAKILLDTVTLVYFLEQHPRYGMAAKNVFRRIESGDLRGLMASLVFAELLVPLHRSENGPAVEGLVDHLSNFRNLQIVSGSTAIMVEASRLRARYGLRTPDAIHAATALQNEANGILTNDKRLARLAPEGLRVWLFDELTPGNETDW